MNNILVTGAVVDIGTPLKTTLLYFIVQLFLKYKCLVIQVRQSDMHYSVCLKQLSSFLEFLGVLHPEMTECL